MVQQKTAEDDDDMQQQQQHETPAATLSVAVPGTDPATTNATNATNAISTMGPTTPIPIPTAADVATAVARDGCYAFYSPQLAMFLGAQSVQQPYPSISIAFCLVT